MAGSHTESEALALPLKRMVGRKEIKKGWKDYEANGYRKNKRVIMGLKFRYKRKGPAMPALYRSIELNQIGY